MLKEFILTIPFKLAALLGTLLFAKELLSFPNEYLGIVYTIGWINLLKVFDLSMPYLARVNFTNNIKLHPKEIYLYALFISIGNFLVLYYFANLLPAEIILIIFSTRAYSYFAYVLNISQNSYLINAPFSLSLLSIIFLRFYGYEISTSLFVNIYAFLTALLFLISIYLYRLISSDLANKPFVSLVNKNYLYNLATMSLWAVSSELYSIYSLEVLSTESYTKINQYIRISLIFISIAGVISNINWNQFHNKVSMLDHIILKPLNAIFMLPLIYLVIYVLAIDFSVFEIIILSVYSYFSMQTLHLSQLSARLSLSNLLLISAIFEFSVLFIGLNILENHFFLLLNSLAIQITKYFFLRYYSYIKLKKKN